MTHPGANSSPPICAVAFSVFYIRYAGSSFTPLKKLWACRVAKVNVKTSKSGHAYFCDGSNTPARAVGRQLRISEANRRSILGESRTCFCSHTVCMEESYEYANEFGKHGRKNPRYIPKFTINREPFSRAIEKKYLKHRLPRNMGEAKFRRTLYTHQECQQNLHISEL